MNALLEVESVSKRFRASERAALASVDLVVEAGETVSLVGASGSGKTTLLRIIAGLETADSGEVRLDGRTLNREAAIVVPPERRNMGLLFQGLALFPHLTVAENVGFGLQEEWGPARVDELMAGVGLTDYADRYPHELSGGERQRVALIRALAPRPSLVLLDEPFSSLDPALRAELRRETRRVLARQGATAIVVTHDAEAALAGSDRIAVLRKGRVQQVGAPREIYRRPANRYVAISFGACNFIDRAALPPAAGLGRVQGIEPEPCTADELWLRPGDLALAPPGSPGALATGRVVEDDYLGASRLVVVECTSAGSEPLRLQVALDGASGGAAIGDPCGVRIQSGQVSPRRAAGS